MRRVMVFCALALVFCTTAVHAGENKDQMLAIKLVKVNPAKMADYEKSVKHVLELYKEHKLDVPAMWVSQSEDMTYHYVIPIENHAGIDHIWKAFGDVRKAIGKDGLAEMEDMFQDTVESSSLFVTKYMADLSYMPDGFNERSKDWNYFEMMVWYIDADHYQDAMQLAKDYKALYTAKGIQDGFGIYVDYMGPDLPVMNVMSWAKDPSHMLEMEKAHKEALGDAAKPLQQQFLSMTRKVEMVRGWYRPDLSYTPKKAAE